MISENLESAKFVDITDEDREFNGKIDRLRRQEYLIGGPGKLKTLLIVVALSAGAYWAYSNLRETRRSFIYSGLKAKKTLESMAGELNQEKKIWDFVDK